MGPRPGGEVADTEPRVNDYDTWAEQYAARNETSAYNALYERPAMLDLIGAGAGMRVLDAGSGPGLLAEALIGTGAAVTCVDASEGMIAVARRRLGDSALLLQADLSRPLPFDDDDFDLVVASLVLHYIEDWRIPLQEFRRVARAGGRLLVSVHHPSGFIDTTQAKAYLSTYEYAETWGRGEVVMPMRFWHRPLSAMTSSFTGAGFEIRGIFEPSPSAELQRRFPEDATRIRERPPFLFFELSR